MQALSSVHYLRRHNMSSIEHQINKLTGHYESVKLQHDNLDAYIDEKYKHYTEDDKVTELKKRKLHLKDEMNTIAHEIDNLKAQLHES